MANSVLWFGFPSASPPAFIQATKNATKVATLTVSAGTLLLVGYGNGGGSGQTPSPADTAGNSWTAVVGSPIADVTNNTIQGMWWAISNGAGSTTVTITTASSTLSGIWFAEYSGIKSTPVDGSNTVVNQTATLTPNALSTGSVTPTTNGDLIVSYIMDESAIDDTAVFTAGTSPIGFTKRDTASNTGDGSTLVYAVEDFVQPTAGAINPTWTYNDPTKYGGFTAAFKAA